MSKRKIPTGAFIAFPITVACVLLADQLSKSLVVAFVSPGESVRLIPGVLSITHVRNTGAAFGIMSGSGMVLFWIAVAVVVLTIFWFYRVRSEKNTWSFVALGLITGGALGNLVDRLFRGRVVDFLDIGWWPVFNVADIAIVTGVIILVITIFLEFREQQAVETGEEPDREVK